MSRRRAAIAFLASLQQFDAMVLGERVSSPDDKAAVAWVGRRLGEIEAVFLARADWHTDDLREQWLDAAEQSLAFYTTELRRLQDRAGVAPQDSLGPAEILH